MLATPGAVVASILYSTGFSDTWSCPNDFVNLFWRLLPTVKAVLGSELGVVLKACVVKASAIDSVRCYRFSAMIAIMDVTPGGALKRVLGWTDLVHSANQQMVLCGFMCYMDSTSKGVRSGNKSKELYDRVLECGQAIVSSRDKAMLPEECFDALMMFVCAMDSAGPYEAWLKALEVKAIKAEMGYQGLLFAVCNHPNFAVMYGTASTVLKGKHKKDAIGEAVATTFTALNSLSSELMKIDPLEYSGFASVASHEATLNTCHASLCSAISAKCLDDVAVGERLKSEITQLLGMQYTTFTRLVSLMEDQLVAFMSTAAAYVPTTNSRQF